MLPHQVSLTNTPTQSSIWLVFTSHSHCYHSLLLQALDPGILDDVPVAPQLVRQPG